MFSQATAAGLVVFPRRGGEPFPKVTAPFT